MKEKLNEHIRLLFADAERRSPDNPRLAELKEELLLNTREKYDHLISMGKTPEAAYAASVNGIGDIEELLNDVIGGTSAEAETPPPAVKETESETEEEATDGVDDDDEDDDEDDGDAKRPPRSPWYKLVSGIIWTVVLAAYFALSFTTHAWSVTWLLFIMGIAADNVAEGIFDLRR